MIKINVFLFSLFFLVAFTLNSQTHISVPLGDPVYTVIEQAQMRGLHRILPGAKPYSRAKILAIIDEILLNDEVRRFGGLTETEREILNQFKINFTPSRGGLDLTRGTISREHTWNDIYFSTEFGFGINLGFSGAFFPIAGGFRQAASADPNDTDPFAGADHPAAGDFFYGVQSGVVFSFMGDLGRNASYGLTMGGDFIKAPRAMLGRMNTFSPGWENDRITEENPNADWARRNRLLPVYSEPLTHFPYTYKIGWDGSVWYMGNLDAGGFEGWPQVLSVGYYMLPELSGTLLNGHVFYRFARLDREWAGMTTNGSLVLNQSAQRFLAAEVTITPFPWFSFSGLTGVLEYGMDLETGRGGIKSAAETFQNAFSVNVLEFNVKNYFHIDFGSATVWPKRFELGYPFIMADTFFYQNNIGDFDNAALFLNLKGQYPGLAKLWFSLFIDEISLGDINRNFFNKSRMMIAYQFGTTVHIPWLSFSSLKISYTKVEPYTYSHTREDVPWYGDLAMETNYVNAGRALGHYIPPNSDEILVRFETMPAVNSMVSLQYQLIRHGAEYGDRAVGGSSLYSELDPWGRSRKPNLNKFFLRDGAYEWMHIIRLGGEYSLTARNLPVRVFGEIGGVYSYFTDIDSSIEPNSGSANPYRIINTPQYPHSFRFIINIGVKIFPK